MLMYHWKDTNLDAIKRYVRYSDGAVVAVVRASRQSNELPGLYDFEIMATREFSVPYTSQLAAMAACQRQINKQYHPPHK